MYGTYNSVLKTYRKMFGDGTPAGVLAVRPLPRAPVSASPANRAALLQANLICEAALYPCIPTPSPPPVAAQFRRRGRRPPPHRPLPRCSPISPVRSSSFAWPAILLAHHLQFLSARPAIAPSSPSRRGTPKAREAVTTGCT